MVDHHGYAHLQPQLRPQVSMVVTHSPGVSFPKPNLGGQECSDNMTVHTPFLTQNGSEHGLVLGIRGKHFFSERSLHIEPGKKQRTPNS